MEIKANELRIGNWVSVLGSEVYRQIDALHILEIIKGDKTYKPIPLSEEVILKCCFEKSLIYENTYHITIETLNGSHDIFIDISANVLMASMIELGSFLYLHQLQNILYSLTGKELEIRL